MSDVIKTYSTDRPVGGAVISPIRDHVILGGGQDAQSVTTTKGSAGRFESRLFHMIYEEEFGRVKGALGMRVVPADALGLFCFGLLMVTILHDRPFRTHHSGGDEPRWAGLCHRLVQPYSVQQCDYLL